MVDTLLVTSGSQVRRLNSLTGLRAAAALSVFSNHVRNLMNGQLHVVHAYTMGFTSIAVDFFFALSGFVLAWNWVPQDTTRAFWQRRFARIYPVYLVGLAVAIPTTIYEGSDPHVWGHALVDLFLVQAWSPHATTYFGVNPVAWTLSSEAFFYLTFPLWFRVLQRLDTKTRRGVALYLYGAIISIPLLAGDLFNAEIDNWVHFVLPLTQIALFATGSILSLEVRAGLLPRLSFRLSVAWFLVFYSCAHVVPPEVVTNWLIPPILFVIVAAAQRDLDGRGTWYSHPRWVYLGDISYCFYLLHYSFIRAFAVAVGTSGNWIPVTIYSAILLTFSVGAAALLHAYVERPFEKRLRGTRPTAAPVRGSTLVLLS